MTGTFACPECGGEVTLLGATPGREVRCARCAARVEVPYLPRDGAWTRPRFRRGRPAWAIRLAWAGVGLLAMVVAAVAWRGAVASRGRAARVAALDGLLAASDAAAKAGRPDRALSELEAALAMLRSGDHACAARAEGLAARRDALSVREAEDRIAGSRTLGPDAAVGDLLSLQARARTDRALEHLVPTILGAVDDARRRQAEASLADARRARDEGRPLDALALAERAMLVAEKIEGAPSRSVAADAEGLMTPILARLGAVVAQLPGKFTLGSPEGYDVALGPILDDALRRHGYAPRPATGPARGLWDRRATRRLEFRVSESLGTTYLQSQNRLSLIAVSLRFSGGREPPWQSHVTARTRVPLPDLPAFASGHLAVAGRERDMEHRLYGDARALALERVGFNLRGLPGP